MQTLSNSAAKPCKGIITYKRFKNDQGVAFALLRMFGKNKYPGIENAPFIFWDVNQGTPDGRPANDWEKEGYVLVAVANSKYDDHPLKHRNIQTCSALLVAEDLGIKDEPYLKTLLDNTLHRDLTGQGHPMMIYTFLKLMHDMYPENQTDVMVWYLQAIEALIMGEYNLFKKTGEEFKKTAITDSCRHKSNTITITSFISDDTEMARFARSKYGSKADVTIQKNSKGQVSINTKTNSYIDLTEVIRLLRLEEKKIQRNTVFIHENQFTAAGTIPEIKEWYYDPNARRILNGGGTASSVPATKIPFKRLSSLVKSGLQKTVRYSGSMPRSKARV